MYHQQFNSTSVICLDTVKSLNSSISNNSIWHKSFLCIQFKMSNSSIWPTDRTLFYHSRSEWHGSDDNVEVLHIPQSSKTRASPSDCLMPYPGHLLGDSYHSAEMQLLYSTTPADCAMSWSEIPKVENVSSNLIRNHFFISDLCCLINVHRT